MQGKAKKGRKQIIPNTSGALRMIINQAAKTPQEYVINRMVLRAMMQARYSPENDGHFGLASSCYCHFTSPIRRYADLIVHRAIKSALGLLPVHKDSMHTAQPEHKTRVQIFSEKNLEVIAEHINGTERKAAEAEREIKKRLTIFILEEKVGEVFAGIVSGVTDFGVFIELPEFMTEGMIPLGQLTDDFYTFIAELKELRGQRTRRSFRIGMSLRVRLIAVNLNRLEIDLLPAYI